MGGYPTDFSWAGKDDPLSFVLVIIAVLILVYICYKSYLYFMERRKWTWYMQLCKEKRLTPGEVTFLKTIVVKKQFTDAKDLLKSIYSLNLPTPIRKKLMVDEQPSRAAERAPGGKPK